MRLTRLGVGTIFMAGLTLMAAAETGNNLLYLLYSALVAALFLSVIAGLWNMRGVRAVVEPGAQGFRGREFPLTVRVENDGRFTAFGLAVCWGERRRSLDPLSPGGRAAARLSCAAEHRGLNRLEGLSLESLFPFALVRHRRVVKDAVVLALPRTSPIRSAAELSADAWSSGRPESRKGRGEELFGVRAYDQGDESRAINWKLSARTGKLLVNEYCEPGPSHVTVRAAGGSGAAAERAIEAAATACRFYSDAGASVELVTPHDRIGPARGLRHLDRMLEALAKLGDGGTPRPAAPPSGDAGAAEENAAWKTMTFLGLALSFSSLFLVDEINQAVLWTLSPLFLAGWWVQRRGRSLLAETVWVALQFAALAYFLADWRLSGPLIAVTHLMLYIIADQALHPLAPKVLERIFLIEFLAFFLASGLTISLWYFAFFLLYLAYAGSWLLLAGGVRIPDRPTRLAVGGVLLSATLGMGAAAFVVTPRVEGLRKYGSFLAAGIDKLSVNQASAAGYTENVTLGYFGLLKKSSARVMQVKPATAPAGKTAPAIYVRGAAYDVFENPRWEKTPGDFTMTLRGRRYTSMSGRMWAAPRGGQIFLPAKPSRGELLYDFTVYPMGLNVIFTVGTPRVMWSAEPVSFDRSGNLAFANPYGHGARYRLSADPEGGGFSLALSENQRRAALIPLSKDPRVDELARRAVAGVSGERAKIAAVEAFLRRGYRYTLFGEGAGHTLEDFLFKSKRGNCEYFATAGVALLRAAGVPARLATGFLASDWNEFGKFYDVRQSEAHAWVEAFVPAKGWVTVDPTPSQGLFSAAVDDFSHKVSRWFDAVQIEWYRHVIGYDQYVQGNTFRRLSLALSPRALARAAQLAGKALVFLMVLSAPVLLWLGRGKLKTRRAPTLWERAEAALASYPRRNGLTPREFSRTLEGRFPALPKLAELHYAQAYGGRKLTSAEEAEAHKILRELKDRA